MYSDEIEQWPRDVNNNVLECFYLSNVTNVTITSSGTGLMNGKGNIDYKPLLGGLLLIYSPRLSSLFLFSPQLGIVIFENNMLNNSFLSSGIYIYVLGKRWWGFPFIGYLVRQEHRPRSLTSNKTHSCSSHVHAHIFLSS